MKQLEKKTGVHEIPWIIWEELLPRLQRKKEKETFKNVFHTGHLPQALQHVVPVPLSKTEAK